MRSVQFVSSNVAEFLNDSPSGIMLVDLKLKLISQRVWIMCRNSNCSSVIETLTIKQKQKAKPAKTPLATQIE
jgi:hypothetical protein